MSATRGHPRLRRLVASIGLGLLSSVAIASALAYSLTRPLTGDASGGPTPTPAATVEGPHLAMPYGDECLGCHLAADGSIGHARIPLVAHPSDWGECTACHANDRLVTIAPGHDGIGADLCQTCHVSDTAAAPPRAHEGAPDMICLDCHGKTSPMPDAMLTRSGANCWICHHSPNAR